MELYYKNPAKCWLEGFPLGNGRMGAVIHGALDHEVLQLNEDTLWSGSPYSGQTGLSPEVVNQARELARAGKYEEAKQASIRDLGTTEDDEYTFYDVTFIADGVEIEVPDEAVVINMEFKNVAPEENETQSALHIQETEAGVVAQDVTAQSADGTLKSVGFNF